MISNVFISINVESLAMTDAGYTCAAKQIATVIGISKRAPWLGTLKTKMFNFVYYILYLD